MAEYIEREAMVKASCERCDGEYVPCDKEHCLLMEVIHSIPAADVRPVARGAWVGIDDFPHEDWECDNCGCVVGNTDDPWNYYHYCPNCGAYMMEES